MNKSYRIVWNQVRRSFMVVSEATRSKGKAGGSASVVVGAVAAAVMTMGSGEATATTLQISSALGNQQQYVTNQYDALDVQSGGSVMTQDTTAVTVPSNAVVQSLVNNGTISATSNQSQITFPIAALNVYASTTSGGITNGGLIQGAGVGLVDGIQLSASVINGGIQNQAGGTITSGNAAGIHAYSGSQINGGITNAGLISSDATAAISFAQGWVNPSPAATVTGGIQNLTSGTISGATGIYLASSQLNGGITNAGKIEGWSYGSILITASTVSGGIQNQVGGTITGGVFGLRVTYGSHLSNGISNAGLIESSGNQTMGIGIAASTVSGGIQNLASGTIRGGAGVQASYGSLIDGGIANAGLIQGSQQGIDVASASSVSGGIQNLVGGTITSAGVGLRIVGGSQINDGITNAGLIESSGNVNGTMGIGIAASTVNGGIQNLASGTISGGQYGMLVDFGSQINGGITNAGVIQSSLQGINVASASTVSGGIQNLAGGTIAGGQVGLRIAGGSQINDGIVNAGLIQASSASGIYLYGAGVINGGIQNQAGGTITGANVGIDVLQASHINGGITNAGLISGGTNAIYVASNSSLDNILIVGNNTASFGGAVYAPNTPVTVAGGATYTLNSNFAVSNFNNQGTLIAPVASVASPTITGNLTLGNTGTFSPIVASPTSYTKISVSGNAALGGALVVDARNLSSIAAGTTLHGVISASSVTGTFANYSTNSVLYKFTPVYEGTELALAIAGSDDNEGNKGMGGIAQQFGNKAALGAASVLDAISRMTGVMAPVTTAFGQMTSAEQINNAMSQTLPVMSGATVWNTMSVLTGINRIIEARHLVNKGISSGEDFSGNNALWMKPFGTWTDQGNQNGAYGFKANTGGLMLGGDTTVGADTRLGLAFGWGNSYATSNAGVAPQSQTSNLYQFIGYGSYALSETLEANFQANGGWNSNTSNRQIGFMGTSAQGSYNSAVWHIGAGLSNPVNVTETTQIIPAARFDYTWIKNQGYSETGASNGLGLNVNSETYQTSILGADLKGIQKLSDHNSVNANIGVGYNFSPTQTWVAASFQGAPGLQFTTNGINPQAVMGRAGAGYTYKVNNGLDLGVRYDLDFQNSYTNQTATAKARWMF